MEQYLPIKVLADRLGVSGETVRRWSATGILPPPIRLGRRILFRVSDLERFDAEQTAARAALAGTGLNEGLEGTVAVYLDQGESASGSPADKMRARLLALPYRSLGIDWSGAQDGHYPLRGYEPPVTNRVPTDLGTLRGCNRDFAWLVLVYHTVARQELVPGRDGRRGTSWGAFDLLRDMAARAEPCSLVDTPFPAVAEFVGHVLDDAARLPTLPRQPRRGAGR